MSKTPTKPLLGGLGCHIPPTDLIQLDPHLLPGGPKPGEVIELTGGSNCGKSSLAQHLIATALLPHTWRGIKIGGCGAVVMLVDCDLHFSILQLENRMQKRIKQCLRLGKDALKKRKLGQQAEENVIVDEEEIRKLLHSDKGSIKNEIISLVKQCLKSLSYLRCTNSTQYAITLLSLEEYMMELNGVSLLVIDSLSAYSWYDRVYRAKSWTKLKDYYNGIFTTVMACIKKYSVVMIATKGILFSRKFWEDDYRDKTRLQTDSKEEGEMKDAEEDMEGVSERELFGNVWSSHVTHRIILSLQHNPTTGSIIGQQTEDSFSERNDTTSSVSNVTPGGSNSIANKSLNSTTSCSDRYMYTAELTANQNKTKLMYAIHEEGIRWQNK
ncbi:hypothetical protein Pmani_011240 [Petrolisthes manimaculis]|uniref:Uncharacterized protein n=1 Tax=Petrolisthes manimaculis TaxID=1843537 RepID=A0AAE1Q005_9EUCA|nr:hypothetical protein Pmani_011240 [Petrolisthes manimaculis]